MLARIHSHLSHLCLHCVCARPVRDDEVAANAVAWDRLDSTDEVADGSTGDAAVAEEWDDRHHCFLRQQPASWHEEERFRNNQGSEGMDDAEEEDGDSAAADEILLLGDCSLPV